VSFLNPTVNSLWFEERGY